WSRKHDMSSTPGDQNPKSNAPVPFSSAPLGRIRILHVEDNPSDAELIRLELRRGGIDVEMVLVDSLIACETALAQSKFDLIISDYNLPGGDGVSVLHGIRQKHA